MDTIKCLIQEERTFDQGFVAEVKVIEGSIPQMIGVAGQVQCNDTIYQLPIQIVETCKNDRKYRLFFSTAAYQEQKRLQIAEQLRYQIFELKVSDNSFFQLQPSDRKMLLLIDESALFESLAIIDFLSLKKIETDIYIKAKRQQWEIIDYVKSKLHSNINFLSSSESQEAYSILDEQIIGTKLFISGLWPMVHHIEQMAKVVGFTDEEIQYKGIGRKKEKVFCVKCYSYNRKKNQNEITCEHCKTVLDVSSHFSKRLDAYLGYIHVV
ncbi:hypothetical protein LAV79_22230 [Peribacillus butanolivorans]|uniref:dimethylamine monooxygenase subunit DmmA family protein n=1 Tax=Peribacillus butanolivorans TaxID=421767 RepID=UPI0030C9FBA4